MKLTRYQRVKEIEAFLLESGLRQTAQEIYQHLLKFESVTLRTVQCSLKSMSEPQGLYGVRLVRREILNNAGKSRYFAYELEEGGPGEDGLEGMEDETWCGYSDYSLYFGLTSARMEHLLPERVVDYVEQHIWNRSAEEKKRQNLYRSKIFASSKAYHFELDERFKDEDWKLFEHIMAGLCEEKRLELTNQQGRVYVVSPLGIWLRDNEIYAVALDHKDPGRRIKTFKVIRLRGVKILDQQAEQVEGFSIKEFATRRGIWGVRPGDQASLDVVIRVRNKETYWHIRETKLSPSQTLTEPDPQGISLLTATGVPNTEELRWWLRSFASHLEVLQPLTLRYEMAQWAGELVRIYGKHLE